MAGLSDAERNQLTRLLEQVRDNLSLYRFLTWPYSPARRRGLKPVLAALAAALILAGCASSRGLAPEDAPLDADALQAQRSLSGAAASDAAFPTQDWWTSLGDAQLDALIAEALAGTPSLDAADARVRQAVAQAGLADAARKPTLTRHRAVLGRAVARDRRAGAARRRYQGVGVLGLSFNYTFDLWGGERARWQAARGPGARRGSRRAGRAPDAVVEHRPRLRAAGAGVLRARRRRSPITSAPTSCCELGRQRVAAGLDNQLQIRQAESARGQRASSRSRPANTKSTSRATRSPRCSARARSRPRHRPPDIAEGRRRRRCRRCCRANCSATAPTSSPRAGAWKSARHGIKASKAAFYPTRQPHRARRRGRADSVGDLFSSDALLINGGPALSLPIFDGGRLRNQLARSDAEYDLAVADYNQTLVGAVREVADAVQSARSLDAQIVSATQARDAAQPRGTSPRKRYKRRPGHAARRARRAAPAARARPAARPCCARNAWPHPSTSIAPSAAAWSALLPTRPTIRTTPTISPRPPRHDHRNESQRAAAAGRSPTASARRR